MKSRCFFIGHRDAPASVREALEREVENLIAEHGVTEFIMGNRGAFDAMAAGAVKKAKQNYPGMTLLLLLPYHPGERPVELPEGFDGSIYPFDGVVPKQYAIVRANRAMVDCSDYLIAYAHYPGNARNLVEYAERKNIVVRLL